MSDYVVETTELCKWFGEKQALRALSLQVARGGVHAIVGANGAGKSTLFRLLLGFMTPNAGECLLLGEDSSALLPATRGRVGYVNEEHTLPGWLKVEKLKRMQRAYYPGWNEQIYRKVINHFDVDPRQKVGSLSRGERAGFNLAMALAQNPELLILDEPTLGLDVVAKQEFLDALLFCADLDTTVIYCSHQMEEVERLADELIIIERGALKHQSSPDRFGERVQLFTVDARQQRIFLECVPGVLSSRQIADKFHAYVLDPADDVERTLATRGVADVVRAPIGLDTAVRAFLALNHARASMTEQSSC